MADLTLSIPFWGPVRTVLARDLLGRFEAESGIHVELQETPAQNERTEIRRFALYHHGPDVTQLGTTWVRDLVSMNALYAFSERDIERIGGANAFVPGLWQTGKVVDVGELWAIPFSIETMMIHYRADLLEKAGVDPEMAFRSLEDLNEAAERLRLSGVDVPVEFPPTSDYNTLHALSGWIWSAGGDYCSPDGQQVWFDRPEVLKTICDYYRLQRHHTQVGNELVKSGQTGLFLQGRSAVYFYPTVNYRPAREGLAPGVWENWRATTVPGQPYVGGQNLIVWKHTHFDHQAVELVRFLTSQAVQKRFLLELRQLSPRLDVLSDPEVMEHAVARDPVYQAAVQAQVRGRSYSSVPLWGMIEERLLRTLPLIEHHLLDDLDAGIEETVAEYLLPLAKRLNITLAK